MNAGKMLHTGNFVRTVFKKLERALSTGGGLCNQC